MYVYSYKPFKAVIVYIENLTLLTIDINIYFTIEIVKPWRGILRFNYRDCKKYDYQCFAM